MFAAHGSPRSQPEQTEKSMTNTHPIQPGRYTERRQGVEPLRNDNLIAGGDQPPKP